ncbi:MAG: hypothetical protein Q4G07_10230, partial [Oscillospiraceae bacterium]|nr:hypothetical protein [Oscillospiraceae bacterium]
MKNKRNAIIKNSRSEAKAIFLANRPVAALAARARPLRSNIFYCAAIKIAGAKRRLFFWPIARLP